MFPIICRRRYALRALLAMHDVEPDAAHGRLQELLNRVELDCGSKPKKQAAQPQFKTKPQRNY